MNKTTINQRRQCQASQHKHGTMATASPSWHDGSSIAAACAIQPVMVSKIFFKNNNQPAATATARKVMVTSSQHSNSGTVA